MISRRQFLKYSAIAGTALALPMKFGVRQAHAFVQSPGLSKFVLRDPGGNPILDSGGNLTPIPLRGINVIPVAASDGTRTWGSTVAQHYTINITQFTDQLHPELPNPTTLWGYHPVNVLAGSSAPKHLGGIIVVRKNAPVQITFRNNLPATHILPVDPTIMGAEGAQNRTSVHLHGGHVPWISDGTPFAWWGPNGAHGSSFLNNAVLNPSAAANEAEFYYPNDQSARLLWYHDHALGITRINAYAGIATGYIIRDAFEDDLVMNKGLPRYVESGGYELPIIIQDKIFVPENIGVVDSSWPGAQAAGGLWYSHIYDAKLKLGAPTPPDPSVVPEFFGDTMLANGTVYPEVNVEPRRYRLRILNACNARFLNLQLYVDDGSIDSITLDSSLQPANPAGPDFLQIGTEGGFLPKPVVVSASTPFDSNTLSGSLILAPAERADVIVDFSGFEGQKLLLYNDAPAPFPSGDLSTDYFPDNPDFPGRTTPGFGPNTRQIMRFNVGTTITLPTDPPLLIDTAADLTAGNDPLFQTVGSTSIPVGVKRIRDLTLNETFDSRGRLLQLLGTTVPVMRGTYGRAYMDAATETPEEGDTEVWRIFNLSGDTHPIHFHLVNVQILSRQLFKLMAGRFTLLGSPSAPDPNEAGWKETVRMNPGECTTVIMKFSLPDVPFIVPESPRTGGNEYVWHCHILEHEEHDMMRPLVVRA